MTLANEPSKMWRHPDDAKIVVSYRYAIAIALMQMGISDFALIADATGLDIAAVKRIDAAEDPAIRLLAVAGIPNGEFFKLRRQVKCPSCHGRINTAPCVFCAQHAVK